MFYDDLLFHFRHVCRQGLTERIFSQLHWLCFALKKFSQHRGGRKNKVSGFSYHLSISTPPCIPKSFLLLFPSHNGQHLKPFLLFLDHTRPVYIPARANQALNQDDYTPQNNLACWGAFFPVFQFLS